VRHDCGRYFPKKIMMSDRVGQIAFLVLAAILAGAISAHAQTRKPTAAEIKLVRDCADKHPDDGKGEEECAFKLVADPCIEKNGSNLGTADCYRIETVIWDAILNDNYKQLMEAIDDKADQDKLKEMQRAWIAYRNTTCDFYWYKIHGSMSVPMTAACQLRETARRAMLLAFLIRV
jgi:uncharacterized protein YecT (DUF1311 family)